MHDFEIPVVSRDLSVRTVSAIRKGNGKKQNFSRNESILMPSTSLSRTDLCKLHDDIIDCLIKSSNNCIPTVNNNSKQKTIPGWNDYVKKYFESSLFWHNMWVQNGRPQQGIIAELRKSTRSKYHSAYKMVQKKEAEIRCDKMAEAIAAKSTTKMYRYALCKVI